MDYAVIAQVMDKVGEVCVERAADAMVEVDWVEGDPAALPFPDASFDRVISIFADPSERVVDEMRRVCRGRIAMYALTVLEA